MNSAWPRSTIRERYEKDNNFARLVDTMRALIDRAEFTPMEIREAAMLAQIMYEETHIRPIVFTRGQVIRGDV